MVENPAALAELPASELRLTGRYLSDDGTDPAQGHALSFGLPLGLLGLSTALRLDLVDPPTRAALTSFGRNANYQWLTWGLAWRASQSLRLGATFQRSFSSLERFDGLGSFSLGLIDWPSNYLGFSFAAHDLDAPSAPGGAHVHRSFRLGVGIRPLGESRLELGLDGSYVDARDGYFIPRAVLGWDIPGLGRLEGDFALADPSEEAGPRRWLAGLKLAVQLNGASGSSEVGVGSLVGNNFGDDARYRAYENLASTVAFRAFRTQGGISTSDFALRIRIEEGPSPRGQVALLRKLWKIADSEPNVQAVVLQLRSAIAGSLAHLQELRDAVWLLRSRGKKVVCDLGDAGTGSLYFCSAADAIVLAPGGRLRFGGFAQSNLFIPELLEKLGIKAEYARIGAHKSAPEMFSHTQSSDQARADRIDLIQQFERHVTWGIAEGRKISPENVRARAHQGPFSPGLAKTAGLVDSVGYVDEVERELSRLLGRSLPLVDERAPQAPHRYTPRRGVALIYLDGDMVDGRSQNIPVVGVDLVGSYTIAEAICQAAEDGRVGAIVVRLETPGGSALAADVIFREIARARAKKPVIVSIGGVGASAGYYVAAAGDRVYANPLSITGSIGVFAGKVDSSELLRKVGVSIETFKTAPRADADSLFRPLTPEERRELERKVAQFYDLFITRVSEGRSQAGVPLAKAEVDAVGQGRVWTGEQAQRRKLVDELGGLRQALAEARRRADLAEDAPIFELPKQDGNLVLRLLGLAAAPAAPTGAELLPKLGTELARALLPLTIHGFEWPLARLEFLPPGETNPP